MYQVESSGAVVAAHRRLLDRARGRGRTGRVSRTVVLLGLVSLFTDISSEMVATILPLYLVTTLGFSPLQFGVVDGLYQGAAALVRIGSGFVGDRWQRHKEVAGVGYGLSAVCKLGLVVAGGAFAAISAVVLADRTGKGIRTAPRDALISLSTPRDQLGAAFGVHRALDTTGAMLGPLCAFGLLALAPSGFDTIFLVSFFFALIGVGILVLFVDNPRPGVGTATAAEPAAAEPSPAGASDPASPSSPAGASVSPAGASDPASPSSAAGASDPAASREARTTPRDALALFRVPRLRALLVAGAALGLATASDGFLYLILQRKVDLDTSLFPLLFVGTALVYMLLAVPVGRLADRVGRGRVFLAGYAVLGAVYAALLAPTAGVATVVVVLALLGVYYAATDGVLMALASAFVPEAVRGSGLALVATSTSVARLLASIIFGALWVVVGMEAAIACFAGGLAAAVALTALVLVRTRPQVAHG